MMGLIEQFKSRAEARDFLRIARAQQQDPSTERIALMGSFVRGVPPEKRHDLDILVEKENGPSFEVADLVGSAGDKIQVITTSSKFVSESHQATIEDDSPYSAMQCLVSRMDRGSRTWWKR